MRSLTFFVAGSCVTVLAPERIAAVLEQMLARLSVANTSAPALTVSVAPTDVCWTVTVESDPPGRLNVGRNALPAQIAGTTVSAIVAALAAHNGARPLRGAVVARDARALALRGRDWRELFVLTAHLCARGWGVVAGAATFVENERDVRPLHKLLYTEATAIERVPRAFRGALETSPWFIGDREILYYAVDPANALGPHAWSDAAQLAGVLDVDARGNAAPSIIDLPGPTRGPHAALTPGTAIATTDAVERWWDDTVLAPSA